MYALRNLRMVEFRNLHIVAVALRRRDMAAVVLPIAVAHRAVRHRVCRIALLRRVLPRVREAVIAEALRIRVEVPTLRIRVEEIRVADSSNQ